MEKRQVGRTGLRIDTLGLGGAPLGGNFVDLDRTQAAELIQAAKDAGISYFDTAPWYGFGRSERVMGDLLRGTDHVLSDKVGRLLRPGAVARPMDYGMIDPLPFHVVYDYSYDGIMKVPMKQPKKGRLWLNDGSCVRLRPEHRNHVWSYDFVHCRTDDGKAFRILNIIDEYSRECLAIRVDRKLNSGKVIDVLSDLFILRGVPSYIRSDNGPEFVAQAVQDWVKAVGAKTAYIEPGSPWENGYCESFNARFRDEFLNGEIFYSLREAQILIEEWRKHYNTKRPHSALGHRTPAPETIVQMDRRP